MSYLAALLGATLGALIPSPLFWLALAVLLVAWRWVVRRSA